MPVTLTIKKPGSLLSRLFQKEISDEDAAVVMRLLTDPDIVVIHRSQLAGANGLAELLKKPAAVGFQPPVDGR